MRVWFTSQPSSSSSPRSHEVQAICSSCSTRAAPAGAAGGSAGARPARPRCGRRGGGRTPATSARRGSGDGPRRRVRHGVPHVGQAQQPVPDVRREPARAAPARRQHGRARAGVAGDVERRERDVGRGLPAPVATGADAVRPLEGQVAEVARRPRPPPPRCRPCAAAGGVRARRHPATRHRQPRPVETPSSVEHPVRRSSLSRPLGFDTGLAALLNRERERRHPRRSSLSRPLRRSSLSRPLGFDTGLAALLNRRTGSAGHLRGRACRDPGFRQLDRRAWFRQAQPTNAATEEGVSRRPCGRRSA